MPGYERSGCEGCGSGGFEAYLLGLKVVGFAVVMGLVAFLGFGSDDTIAFTQSTE